jgi:cytoskeletal protein RodZ
MSKNYIWGVVIVVIIIILAIIWGVNRDDSDVNVEVPTSTDDIIGSTTPTGTTGSSTASSTSSSTASTTVR